MSEKSKVLLKKYYERFYKKPFIGKQGFYMTVKSGDTLSQIAKDYGHSVRSIMEWNKNLIKSPNEIQAGWNLRVPENPSIGPLATFPSFFPKIEKRYKEIKTPMKEVHPIKEPSYYYEAWKNLPPSSTGKEVKETMRLYEESLKKEEGKFATKPISLREITPYLPETIKEIPGVGQVYKVFDWWNRKVIKPSLEAMREKVMEAGAKPVKFYKLSKGEIAVLKRADRLGLVDPAVANAYFERDMRNELSLQDFIQIRFLREKVIAARIKGWLKR